MASRVVRVVVDSRVRLSPGQLAHDVARDLKAAFTHSNPEHHKLKAMGRRFDHRRVPLEIKTYATDADELSLPRGGMGKVRAILGAAGHELHVVDLRTEGELPERYRAHFEWPERMWPRAGDSRALYPDQERIVDACLAEEQCVIRGGTGGGKTSCLLALIQRVRLPALVVVWTGGLFDQWVERVEEELGIDRRFVGQVRGGKRTYSPVTIAMQQTLAKIPEGDPFWRWWGVVAADELSRFAAPTFTRSIDPLEARYRVGASADERRKDGKTWLIYDHFGDVGVEVGHDELVALDRVVDVSVVLHRTGWHPRSNPEADALLGEPAAPSPDEYKAVLDAMEQDGPRTELAIRIAAEEARAGHQVLVFSQRVEHCRRIDARLNALGVTSGLLVGGEEHKQEFQRTIARMRAGEVRAAVGTVQAVGLGINLPSVSRGVVCMPVLANKQLFGQVRGRLCRKSEGKADAVLHYLWDERVFLGHDRNARKWARVVSVA